MVNSDKQIQDWQDKIRSSFGEESRLYQYLFETLDNFYYRYLENDEYKNLKTQELAPKLWGAKSYENKMAVAFKTNIPEAKKGITELAKSVPKSQNPTVRYTLCVEVKELNQNKGHLIIQAEINWGFPEFNDPGSLVKKNVSFKYDDLAVFRKQLALKLEEAAELFI